MHARNRISQVFRTAHEIQFDDSSRIVIMSDCHRGDGGWADAFANNQNLFYASLYEYEKQKFTYIELGDGDELWENKKIQNTIVVYNYIFKLLSQFHKEGRLYFLYGNHDIEKRKPDFSNRNYSLFDAEKKKNIMLFPDIKIHEGLILRYGETNHKIFLLHGHQADFFSGTLWRVSRFLVRYLWRPLELLGVNDPTSATTNKKRKNKVEKRLLKWAKKENQMLIAGHTHRSVFPEPRAPFYFNDGSCVHLHFITALEIEHGRISLVKWSNKTKEDGTIYVGRDVLAGPRELSEYFRSQRNLSDPVP